MEFDEGAHPRCIICSAEAPLFDVVDFNKSCLGANQNLMSGIPIYYARCQGCGFTFADEMCRWPPEKFVDMVYNDEYAKHDPDYLERRPISQVKTLEELFGQSKHAIHHMDFGGGEGLLSRLLGERGWASTCFDPFAGSGRPPAFGATYDLITAFEVFEHVPDIRSTLAQLLEHLSTDGMILFSTLLSDKDIQLGQRLTWWYAAPRNGHISLYTRKSLEILAKSYGLQFGSFNVGLHMFFRSIPAWAKRLRVVSA